MQIVIAPDKFKESLTAQEVADAIRDGFSAVFPEPTSTLFRWRMAERERREFFLAPSGVNGWKLQRLMLSGVPSVLPTHGWATKSSP